MERPTRREMAAYMWQEISVDDSNIGSRLDKLGSWWSTSGAQVEEGVWGMGERLLYMDFAVCTSTANGVQV
jgi:hypothetical protein